MKRSLSAFILFIIIGSVYCKESTRANIIFLQNETVYYVEISVIGLDGREKGNSFSFIGRKKLDLSNNPIPLEETDTLKVTIGTYDPRKVLQTLKYKLDHKYEGLNLAISVQRESAEHFILKVTPLLINMNLD